MPQLSYPFLMDVGSVGLLADSGFKNVLSPIAFENFNVGLGLAKVIGQDYVVRLPQSNLSTTVISADLVTGNVINVSINGVALAPITFATSSAATMNAIAAAIRIAKNTVLAPSPQLSKTEEPTKISISSQIEDVSGKLFTLKLCEEIEKDKNYPFDVLWMDVNMLNRLSDNAAFITPEGRNKLAPHLAKSICSHATGHKKQLLLLDKLIAYGGLREGSLKEVEKLFEELSMDMFEQLLKASQSAHPKVKELLFDTLRKKIRTHSLNEGFLKEIYQLADNKTLPADQILELKMDCFERVMEQLGVQNSASPKYNSKEFYYSRLVGNQYAIPISCLNLLHEVEIAYLARLLRELTAGTTAPSSETPDLNLYTTGISFLQEPVETFNPGKNNMTPYNASLIKPIFAMTSEINRLKEQIDSGNTAILDEVLSRFKEQMANYFKKDQGAECARKYTELMKSAYQIDPSKNADVQRLIDLWRRCAVYKQEFSGENVVSLVRGNKTIAIDSFIFNALTNGKLGNGVIVQLPENIKESSLEAYKAYLQGAGLPKKSEEMGELLNLALELNDVRLIDKFTPDVIINAFTDSSQIIALFEIAKKRNNPGLIDICFKAFADTKTPSEQGFQFLTNLSEEDKRNTDYTKAFLNQLKGVKSYNEENIKLLNELFDVEGAKQGQDFQDKEVFYIEQIFKQMGAGQSEYSQKPDGLYYNITPNGVDIPLAAINLLFDEESPELKKLLQRRVTGVCLPDIKCEDTDLFLATLDLLPKDGFSNIRRVSTLSESSPEIFTKVIPYFHAVNEIFVGRLKYVEGVSKQKLLADIIQNNINIERFNLTNEIYFETYHYDYVRHETLTKFLSLIPRNPQKMIINVGNKKFMDGTSSSNGYKVTSNEKDKLVTLERT